MNRRSLHPFLVCAASLLVGPVGLGCVGSSETNAIERRPRPIILISIDTLRADHLGSYGYARPTSPNLDRFAREEAVLFEEVFSSGGGTLPSHMSLFTSLPTLVHDVTAENGRALDPNRVTLAEILSEQGYVTAAFTGGAFMMAKYGFDQGFDYFDDSGGDFEAIMPKARSWLEENSDKDLFLFLHTYDVHSDGHELPYDAPSGFNERFTAEYQGSFDGCLLGECASQLLLSLNERVHAGEQILGSVFDRADLEFIIGLYDGGIAYVDSELDRFFKGLRELGLYDDAIIVITSDHGEEFLDHRLFLHVQSYEEVARIPLLVKLPDQRFAGTRIGGLTSILDISPTIVELIGLQPGSEMKGRSLLPRIEEASESRAEVFIYAGLEKLRTDRWSLLVLEGKPVQLFDLITDPTESNNVLHKEAQQAARLFRVYKEMRAEQLSQRRSLNRSDGSPEVELSSEEVDRLRALGYID